MTKHTIQRGYTHSPNNLTSGYKIAAMIKSSEVLPGHSKGKTGAPVHGRLPRNTN